MSSNGGNNGQLTAEQKARIEENRRQALERLKNRNLSSNKTPQSPVQQKNTAPSKILPTKVLSSSHRVNPYLNPRVNQYSNQQQSSSVKPNQFNNNNKTNSYQTNVNRAVSTKASIKCTIEILSEDRFCVKTSGYDEKIIQEFKKIPTSLYHATKKDWSFHFFDYDKLVNGLGSLQNVVVVKIPHFVINAMQEKNEVEDESCLNQIDPTLVKSLLDFQRTGICFGISKKGRCMIADDMGLGKTRQAIGIADFYRDDWPLLVVTNASTRQYWSTELLNLISRLKPEDIQILQGNKNYFHNEKVVICSYNNLQGSIDDLLTVQFGAIIFDESHNLKNSKTKQAANAETLAKNARRIIMLTGTPALSRPAELFSQLKIIDKNFATYMQFTERYCNGMQTRFGWNATGSSNLEELNILLKKKFLIRRIKSDVFLELSAKNRELVILDKCKYEGSLKWVDQMEEFRNEYIDAENSKKDSENILMKWYQITSMVKIDGVCKFIKKYLNENDGKILVFAHHREMMSALCAELEKANFQHIKIDGAVSGESRAERVDRFQNDPNIRAAVLSIKACNAGITLTAANTVIFCELDWNPSTIIQAEARAHRIGQENEVKVFFLLATMTADDVIWQLLQQKQAKLGKAGLVANVENFTDTIKTTKFNVEENKFVAEKNSDGQSSTTKENKVDYFNDDDDDDMNDEEFLKLLENLP